MSLRLPLFFRRHSKSKTVAIIDIPAKLPTPAIIPTDLPENTFAAGAAALDVAPGMPDVVVGIGTVEVIVAAIDAVVDTGAEVEDDAATEVEDALEDGIAVRVTVTVGALLVSSIVRSEAAEALTACRAYLGGGIEDTFGDGVGVSNRVGGSITLGVSRTLGVSSAFGVLTFGDVTLAFVGDGVFSFATWTSGVDAGCGDVEVRSSSSMPRPRLSGGGGAFRLGRANIVSDCWLTS